MDLKVSPLLFLCAWSPCCMQSRWGNRLMDTLSVKDTHSSQNQRPADKCKGSRWHNRTVGRQDSVCPYAFKAVFYCWLSLCLPTCTQGFCFCYIYVHFDLKSTRMSCFVMRVFVGAFVHVWGFLSEETRKRQQPAELKQRMGFCLTCWNPVSSSAVCFRAADRDMDREER